MQHVENDLLSRHSCKRALRMHGWGSGWLGGWAGGWVRVVGGWVGGWMDGWMDGWMRGYGWVEARMLLAVLTLLR